MLQGLMHHIVLQQRVTLDCALLSHLQDCLLTPYTEDMHNHIEHTRSTNYFETYIRSIAACSGFHACFSFVCIYMSVCLYVMFECTRTPLRVYIWNVLFIHI